MTDLFYQCRLHQGAERLVGWIEARAAKEGARIEVKGRAGLWDVIAVFGPPMDASWLKEKQRRDRGRLPSLVSA